MRASEAVGHLPFNERQLIAFAGDREYDMPEITTIRNRWMLDTLDLRDRFYRYKETNRQLIDDLMEFL